MTHTQTPEPVKAEFLSPRDTATVLGVTRQTVYALANDGKLESIKVGKARRISRQSIDAFIAAAAVPAGAQPT